MITPTDMPRPRMWNVSIMGKGQSFSRRATLKGRSFSHWKKVTRCILILVPQGTVLQEIASLANLR
jgi:hypothetical protein